MSTARTTIGWREWVALPDLGVEWIKAKSDTGARSSSLHAFGLQRFDRAGEAWVRFEIHPWQRSAGDPIVTEAPLVDERAVKSSSGKAERRPVIRTSLLIGGRTRAIDLTLTRRDEMGFRMLLGREALRGAYVVDPGRSYVTGRPPKVIRVANKRTEDTSPPVDQDPNSEATT